MANSPFATIGAEQSGLAQLSLANANPKPASAKEAATQFEALLIAQMLRSAHESSPGSLSDDDEDSQSATLFDIAGQQFAQMLAKQGGFGLARLVTQGLNQKAGTIRN